MHVSKESEEQSHRRLLGVLVAAEMRVLEGTYAFEESFRGGRPPTAQTDALAMVGDDEVWSQLVPSKNPAAELFAVVRFHFPDGVDNSGFVGWLASLLKREIGTGVFVICGRNSTRGGIFDYWGFPASEAVPVLGVIEKLRRQVAL